MERESPWTAIAAWIGAVVVLMDVLFDSPSLRVADPAYRAAIRDVLGRIQATGRVTQIQSPLDPRFANQVSATRHAALLQFRITGSIGDSATRVVPVLAAAPPPVTRVGA